MSRLNHNNIEILQVQQKHMRGILAIRWVKNLPQATIIVEISLIGVRARTGLSSVVTFAMTLYACHFLLHLLIVDY